MAQRITKLRALLKKNTIDALLITDNANIRYLTGFAASESWLLVTPTKAFYITDFRYILEAKKGLKGQATIVQYKRSLGQGLFDSATESKVRRLGFDTRHLTVNQFQNLKKSCPKNIKLIEADHLVETLREIKDRAEIVLTRKALQIHAQALRMLKTVIKPGKSEYDIFLKLEQFVKANKAKFSFDPIIAAGGNSCYPHARVTDRVLRPNEIVLVDFGIEVGGYKSDLTRMFLLGKIPPFYRALEAKVKQAQQLAIKKIKPGAVIAEVDRAARGYLEKEKLAQYFGHALGHGVGLDIHESPRLASTNQGQLKEGMIITVEPAVYIPGKFGIRLEEMVLVTKKGAEVLSADCH